jgi:hypothetical protein
MDCDFEDLDEQRWEHLGRCEVCTPSMWISGDELCPEGQALRERINKALGTHARPATFRGPEVFGRKP